MTLSDTADPVSPICESAICIANLDSHLATAVGIAYIITNRDGWYVGWLGFTKAPRHPTCIKPITGQEEERGGKGRAISSGAKEMDAWEEFKEVGNMATRLIEVIKDGGGLLRDGGEEGSGIKREVVARR